MGVRGAREMELGWEEWERGEGRGGLVPPAEPGGDRKSKAYAGSALLLYRFARGTVQGG